MDILTKFDLLTRRSMVTIFSPEHEKLFRVESGSSIVQSFPATDWKAEMILFVPDEEKLLEELQITVYARTFESLAQKIVYTYEKFVEPIE